MKKVFTATLVLAAMLAASSAKAVLVNYTVAGDSVGIGGDTVTLLANAAGAVNVTENGPTANGLLNNVTWLVTSAGAAGTYSDTLSRLMTVTLAVGGSQLLEQDVEVTIVKNGNSNHQDLDIASSSPLHFLWTDSGFNYDLQVTALALHMEFRGSNNQLDDSPVTLTGAISGEFSLTSTAVPEPTTMVAGALLLLPLGATALRILRRNRKATA